MINSCHSPDDWKSEAFPVYSSISFPHSSVMTTTPHWPSPEISITSPRNVPNIPYLPTHFCPTEKRRMFGRRYGSIACSRFRLERYEYGNVSNFVRQSLICYVAWMTMQIHEKQRGRGFETRPEISHHCRIFAAHCVLARLQTASAQLIKISMAPKMLGRAGVS